MNTSRPYDRKVLDSITALRQACGAVSGEIQSDTSIPGTAGEVRTHAGRCQPVRTTESKTWGLCNRNFVCLSTCLSAWQFGSINIHHDAPVQLTYATPSARGENKQSLWGQTLSALRAAIVCCVGATNLSIALPLTCAPNNWYETNSVCVE